MDPSPRGSVSERDRASSLFPEGVIELTDPPQRRYPADAEDRYREWLEIYGLDDSPDRRDIWFRRFQRPKPPEGLLTGLREITRAGCTSDDSIPRLRW